MFANIQFLFTFQTLMYVLPTPVSMEELALTMLTATHAHVLLDTREIIVKQVDIDMLCSWESR